MLIIKDIKNLKSYINQYKSNNQSIGLVPTMGALHHGHGALIKSSKEHNQKTIVSIFVNPKQFNNKEDLDSYPISRGDDYEYCVAYNVDVIFEPTENEIYPKNFKLIKNTFFNDILCDIQRPHHFDGVITIVSQLINIIVPNKIYFGLKDFQQFKIIDKLIYKNFPQIEIFGIETVRNENGLALSSRNKLISQPNREIYKNFIISINNFFKSLNSEMEIKEGNLLLAKFIKEESHEIKNFEYYEFRSDADLSLKGQIKNSRLFFSFYLSTIRVIDNIKL